MRLIPDRVVPAAALLGAAVVLPGAALHVFGSGNAARLVGDSSGNWHFYGVGLSAAVAAAAAVVLTGVGARRGDGRTVLVGTAFTVMAGLLAIHGIATPGILIGDNGVIALTGALTLPLGAAVLALTALPALRRPNGIRPLLVLQAVAFAGIVALGALGMAFPALVPDVPAPNSRPAITFLVLGLLFYGLLLVRALKTYLLTRRPADLVTLVGIVWLVAALAPALTMDYGDLGWWIGHFLELGGIAVVGGAVALDLTRSAQSHSLVGDLRASDLVAQEEAFLGARVRSLMLRLNEKDVSTEAHTRRVALRAVQVGEELGLSPARLRSLAIGGLLHDVGKLSVSTRILTKPSALTDEEFEEVKRHPEWGDRLAYELGFGDDVRQLVRSHHERLDGGGYPDGLTEAALSLDTRILTVCDVYDALVSPRVYRPAWGSERALEHIRAESGSAFDARCVAALEQVVARERAAGQPAAAARSVTAVPSPATAS